MVFWKWGKLKKAWYSRTLFYVLVSKIIFTEEKWCCFMWKIFEVQKFLRDLQICPKLRKSKMWPNSAVKCQINGFFLKWGKLKKARCSRTLFYVLVSNSIFTKEKWCSFIWKIFWVQKFLRDLQICPKITKNQNVTKFCSKMSNYWFFENTVN